MLLSVSCYYRPDALLVEFSVRDVPSLSLIDLYNLFLKDLNVMNTLLCFFALFKFQNVS